MVHCISSSEPDSAEITLQNSESDWSRNTQIPTKQEMTEYSGGSRTHSYMAKKSNIPIHMAYAESSTMVSGIQFLADQMKREDQVVSSRNFEKMTAKRKHGDTLVVMESHHIDTSLFDAEGRLESLK